MARRLHLVASWLVARWFLGGELVGGEIPWWRGNRIPFRTRVFCVSVCLLLRLVN